MSRGLWNTAAQFVERGYAAKAPCYFNIPLLSSRGGTTASLPGEQPCDADAARINKSVRVCSHMVHHKQPHNLFCVAVFNSCRNIWGTIIMAADMADSQRSFWFFKRKSTNLRVREIVA